MAVSIRVTMTRPNISTIWPFDLYPWSEGQLVTNFNALESASVQTWIKGNEDDDLTLVIDHYFPTNELFDSYKTTAYTQIPLWEDVNNKTEADEFIAANNMTVTIAEVTEPDLSGYVQIDLRSEERV